MGCEMPWYSAQGSLDTLMVGRPVGMMHIVCSLRQGSNVFETYWTTMRGVEAMDNSYRLLDLTVYGRQETWEDLNHRDVTFTAVSRATLAKINAYKKRIGWTFPWVSSYGSDFNFDYYVSFTPEEIAEGKACYNYEVRPISASDEQGISVFYKNESDEVFHTYSCHGRHRHGQWGLPVPRLCAQRSR
jgi:predicted dithiol-disulfide oxidoreductase (DUF899 family)